jgi:hypothetical protein
MVMSQVSGDRCKADKHSPYTDILKSAFHHMICFSVEVKTKKLNCFYYSAKATQLII